MKKPELIRALASRLQVTHDKAREILTTLQDIVKIEIGAGRSIEIPGIINLSVQAKSARMARHPATGAPVAVPAKNVVKARVVASLATCAKQ